MKKAQSLVIGLRLTLDGASLVCRAMGALKVGDVISVRNGISDALSVAGQGLATSQSVSPRTDGKVDALAENNIFVTIKSITTDNTPHRVYNLEIESRDGQITHNYFVGEDELWVHNAKKRKPRGKGKFGRCQNVTYIDPDTGEVHICGGDAFNSECREFCRDCLSKNPELRDLSANFKN